MQFELGADWMKAYVKAGGKAETVMNALSQSLKNSYRVSWTVESDNITAEDIELFLSVAKDQPTVIVDIDERRTLRKMRAVLPMRQGKKKKIVNLEVMADALFTHLKPLKRHWVFREKDGALLPWFVSCIEFVPATRERDGHMSPAYVRISLLAKHRGEEEKSHESVERGDLGDGLTPGELLTQLGLMPENDELIANYENELEAYEDYRSMQGEVFYAQGQSEKGPEDEEDRDSWGWGSRQKFNLEREGSASKAVMDDEVGFGKGEEGRDLSVYANQSYWIRGNSEEDTEVSEEEDKAPTYAPIQPFLNLFSLIFHEFVLVHVANLSVYHHDTELIHKLVIPDDHKKLIDVLIHTKTKNSEDLIRGKKGGVVILCSGRPGTGKTLTAEVYAEVAKRPLYTVQCAQLGITSSDLEKELGLVLRRAQRWNAILQLDEADVYIHERGDDVNQNAIVGVFLRLLEYFAGVLFMTTNRATVVDDAIHSRCIAHVRYDVPQNPREYRRLWEIISTQYKVDISEVLPELVKTFPDISGRSIKQLCRLVQALGEEPTIPLFKWLASFQDGIEIRK